jgi:hypothetical protein
MMSAMGLQSFSNRLANCLYETLRRSGAHVDLGARLHRVFTDGGLPQPSMRLEAMMDGRDDSPIYRYAAETLESILPKALEYGITTAGEFDIASVPERLREERKAIGYAVMTLPVVAAWCRVNGPIGPPRT